MSAAPRITVRHADQNYGPYSVEQVNSMLAAGRLLETDLAWVEGTPDWQRLGAVPGILRMPPPVAQPEPRAPDESDRLILPAFVFAFFFGVFGVHRFYVGRTGSGVAMLLLSITGIGLVVTGIWFLVDLVIIACGGFRDADERYLRRWL